MNHIWAAVAATLLMSVGGANAHEHEPNFSYDRQDLWPENCNVASARSQSPINIATADVQENPNLLRALKFNNVWSTTLDGTFSNDGRVAIFVANKGGSETATYSNHLGTYELLNFHVHWGPSNSQGTGHRVNDAEFALEFHFVTVLRGASLANISSATPADIISVIAVLAEADNSADISGIWEKLNASAIIGAGDSIAVTGVSYTSVLPDNLNYYYYSGSQCSPPCYEVVQWFVLENRIKVPSTFVDQLRTLRGSNDTLITLNNRDAQPVNDRTVYRGRASAVKPIASAFMLSILIWMISALL